MNKMYEKEDCNHAIFQCPCRLMVDEVVYFYIYRSKLAEYEIVDAFVCVKNSIS